MKGFDYSKEIKDSKAYDKLRPVGAAYIKMRHEVKYIGLENIPENGGFILASNHIHAMDPVYIAMGLEKRQIHFMGKKELFDNPFLKWLFTKANGFPIVRGGADADALNYAIRVVKEGNILGIFPEGTRSRDFKPARAKNGVAVIAKAAQADVLPVSIYTRDNRKSGTKLTVRFGELIPYAELGITEDGGKEEIRNAASYIMKKITSLWGEGHCE